MSTRNERRAARIDPALDAYFDARDDIRDTEKDQTDDISDLCTDLMHYCTQKGLDPEDIWRRARANFIAETSDEDDCTESEG